MLRRLIVSVFAFLCIQKGPKIGPRLFSFVRKPFSHIASQQSANNFMVSAFSASSLFVAKMFRLLLRSCQRWQEHRAFDINVRFFFGPNFIAGPVFPIWTAKMHSRNNCCRWNFWALVNHFFLSFFSLRNFAVLKPRKETWQDIQMTWNFCSASEWHLSHSSPGAINASNYVI